MAKLIRLTLQAFNKGVEFVIADNINESFFSVKSVKTIEIVNARTKQLHAKAVKPDKNGFVAVGEFMGTVVTADIKFAKCYEIVREIQQ